MKQILESRDAADLINGIIFDYFCLTATQVWQITSTWLNSQLPNRYVSTSVVASQLSGKHPQRVA